MDKYYKPCGYHVVIEIVPLEETSKGGIILYSQDDVKRARQVREIGKVLSFGPLAFKGLSSSCNGPEDWGVKVGDYVEFKKFDGKESICNEYIDSEKHETIRIINDQDIIGVLGEEGVKFYTESK